MTTRDLQEELDKERALLKSAQDRIAIQKKELEGLKRKVLQHGRKGEQSADSSNILMGLISSLEQGVLIVDDQQNIVNVNNNFCEKFGVQDSPESLIGTDCKSIIDYINNSIISPIHYAEDALEILESRIPSFDNELKLSTGLVCSCDYIPIKNENKFAGYILKFKDITRSKTISETFETQRKFYEQILNNVPADIIVFDTEQRYLYVNPMAVSNPELRKWLIGKSHEEYVAHTKKPLEIDKARKNAFNKVLKTRAKQEWEEHYVNPKGETFYHLRVLYPVLDSNNEIEIVIGYGVNITERKKIEEEIQLSEEKYRGIIENMNLGMIEIDTNEKIIYANDRFCKMSGYSLDELISKKATDLFLNGYSLRKTKTKLHKREYGISKSYDLAVKTKDGADRWWLTSATPLFDVHDKLKGTISIHLDITEQKKLAEQLRIAKQETERSSKSKDIFLTNMSHEIRTPLNAIMGLGKLLSKSNLDTRQKNYLNGIENASSNLLSIINDLLDISKIEAGKISIENISFNLENILQQSVNILEHNAEGKGLILTHEIDNRIGPVLIGDPFRLNQVFMNMMSNAIKFTEQGSVLLRAILEKEEDGFQDVLITITDTGVGIKEEYLKTIFDKFTQEDETVVRKFGGTGLGMSITKQLMELMGGSIAIESKKNVGTTVSLKLRFKLGNARVFEKKRTIKNDTINIKGKRILLVEDNNLNRLLAFTILTDYGALITEAENGLEAVEIAKKERFDIALVDIQMPVMDGIQATKIMRKELKLTIPILALTANAVKSHEQKFLEAGMDDMILKPYNEINLVNPIAKWLGIKGQIDIPSEDLPKKEAKPVEKKEATKSKEKLYDLSKLLAICKDDNEFIRKMLSLFVNETPPLVTKMKEGLAAGDFETVRFYAHRMKPSITNLGINTLVSDILKIELTKDDNPELADMVKKLDATIEEVVDQMMAEYPNLKKN